MLTYLLRHGRTTYSCAYRVNGVPGIPVPLDDVGREQCRTARTTLPLASITSWVSSTFPRAVQTARLLQDDRNAPVWTDARLNEIDYGDFEGAPFGEYADWLRQHGPQARPPGARESQNEGIRRMLAGLRCALGRAGPRVVITHGLLVSVVTARPSAGKIIFPEARYVTPIILSDDGLPDLIGRLEDDLYGDTRQEALVTAGETPGRLGNFEPTSAHQQEEDFNA